VPSYFESAARLTVAKSLSRGHLLIEIVAAWFRRCVTVVNVGPHAEAGGVHGTVSTRRTPALPLTTQSVLKRSTPPLCARGTAPRALGALPAFITCLSRVWRLVTQACDRLCDAVTVGFGPIRPLVTPRIRYRISAVCPYAVARHRDVRPRQRTASWRRCDQSGRAAERVALDFPGRTIRRLRWSA
jgi:hypothetical protein